MPKGTRICRVCGKEYEYCKTFLTDNLFRYQDVACSPECGAVYFAEIEASRKGTTKTVEDFDMNEPIADDTTAETEKVDTQKKSGKKSKKTAAEDYASKE